MTGADCSAGGTYIAGFEILLVGNGMGVITLVISKETGKLRIFCQRCW